MDGELATDYDLHPYFNYHQPRRSHYQESCWPTTAHIDTTAFLPDAEDRYFPITSNPAPGQVIFDDIGDADVGTDELVESLIEREIATWDRRLRDQWTEEDMIRFEDFDDEVYLPASVRRGVSVGAKFRQQGRRKRDRVDRESSNLSRQLLLPSNGRTIENQNARPRRDTWPKVEILVPAGQERDADSSIGNHLHGCSKTRKKEHQETEELHEEEENVSLYQHRHFGGDERNVVVNNSNRRREMTFYQQQQQQQSSTPSSSLSPTSGRFYLSSKHWLALLLLILLGGVVGVALPYAIRANEDSDFQMRLQTATTILKQVPLIDGHNDLPWNIRKFLHNRLKDFKFTEDLRQITPWSKSAWSHTDLPRLKAGLVSAQFWAAYVPCEAQFKDAVQIAFEQVDVIRRFTERFNPELTLCTTSKDVVIAHKKGQLCSLIGVEGGHSLGSSLAILRTLYEVGVRYLTLTSTCNTPWADSSKSRVENQSSSSGSGLSNFGRSIVREMNRLGMLVDLSHVSEATMLTALNVTKAPVIFSHSAAYALCNSSRNVPDHVLQKLADNDGVIMINFYSQFLTCKDSATIYDAIGNFHLLSNNKLKLSVCIIKPLAHIEHVRNVAGINHIGLGAGYDGINITPNRLNDVSAYPVLFAELLASGWSEEHLQKLAGLNFLRVLRRVEQIRDELRESGTGPSEDVIAPRLLQQHSTCVTKNLF